VLTALSNKHCEPLAQAVPGTSAPRVPECLTHRPWEAADLNRQRVQTMMAEATTDDGLLGFDDSGFPTQGKASVGGARQYAGTLGQGGNGQLAVTGGDPDPQARWPVTVRLYVPTPWAQDRARRQRARVPAALPLQTTPESALPRLDPARAWGGPQRGVVAEADSGAPPNFVAGLEARQARYGVAGRTDFQRAVGRAASRPGWRADDLRHRVPRWQWRTVRWRRGTQGGWRQQLVAGRGGRATSDGQRPEGWRVGERTTRGQPEARQCYGSTLPATATREELAGDAQRRYAVEPFQEEATGEGGWEHAQGRLWPGFPRPAVTVMRAYRLLVGLEVRQCRRQPRQGRPRDPVSPSA
jgi:SRSO17 transposase